MSPIYALLTQLLSGAPGVASIARGAKSISIDAEIRNGLVKMLAEPTIMAVSGQEGTFLAGGKIYIPVPQSGGTGATVALEEKEFGVGLRFTPTVLEGGQINLDCIEPLRPSGAARRRGVARLLESGWHGRHPAVASGHAGAG